MKKVLLSIVAIMAVLAAGAQNKAISDLATKYSDKEGFTVVNVEGDLLKMMAGQMKGKMDNVDVEKVIENIAAVTVIVSEKAHEEFAEEVKRAVAAVEYTPLVSVMSEGEQVKILSADIKGRGRNDNHKEIVIMVIDGDENVLVRIIGNIDQETMTKMMESLKK